MTRAATDSNPSIRERQFKSIRDAAIEEFSLLGYKATSIQAIADRAGVPKANVHYYFKNKQNLYAEALSHIIELWNASFDEIEPDEDPAIALDRLIRAKIKLSYTHASASRLFANEIIHGADHLGHYLKNDMRKWVREKSAILQGWIDLKKMDPIDPVKLIFLIWSSTQHYADFETQVLTILNRAEYEPEMIDDIASFLSQVILKGCGLKLQ